MFARYSNHAPGSRENSQFSYYFGLLGLALLSVTTLSGCGQSSAQPSADGTAAESAEAPTTADGWLKRMESTYRRTKRYADSGTLNLNFAQGTAGQKVDETVDFSVTLDRPNRLRLHCYQAIVVADGKELRATIGELEGQVLNVPCPQEIVAATLFSDPSLAQALTQIAGSPPQVALLFTDKFLSAIQDGAQPATLIDPRTIDDRSCQGVEIQRPEGRLVLWIDAKTYVIRRIEFPTDGLAKYLEEQIGEPISGAKLTADFRGATFEPALDDTAFKFEMPANAKQVSQFDRRQPPMAPSELLGKTIPEFKFTDIDGAPITRESLAGKVVVFDFWASWCQPCLEGMPNLQQIYDRYKANDEVVIFAVNIDQADITDKQVKEVFAQRKLTVPIARDAEQQSQTLFQVTSIPNLFILGADGNVAHNEIGYNPNLASELPEKLDRLLAGEAIHEQTIKEYEKRKSEFDATFGQATAADPDAPAEAAPGRGEIAAPSEPANHTLTTLWSAADVDKPGNILPLAENGQTRLLVNDGWKRVVELDLAGHATAAHELKVPDLTVVSFLRTAATRDGVRWFAGSANTQPQLQLFDQAWENKLSYPAETHAEIADVQLADLDGDGQPEICVAYWGERGIDVIDLSGKVVWQQAGLENVFRLAVVGPAEGAKTLYAAHARGTIATFDAQGKRGEEISVGQRFVRNLIAADLNGDGEPEFCGLAPVAQDRDVVVGFKPSGEELWTYELPSGLHEQPVEMIVAGRATGESGQWIVAAADGSIQLLAADGKLVDRFHYGSAVTGLGAGEVDGQPALIVSSTEGISAWRLSPR